MDSLNLNNNVPGKLFVLLLFILFFPSCATQQQFDTLDMRVSSLERSIDKTLSRDLNTRLKSIREIQADTDAELDEIKTELQELYGKTEENRHLIKQAIEMDSANQDLVKAKVANLGERIRRLETAITQIQGYLDLEPPPESPPESMKQATAATPPNGQEVAPAQQAPGTAKKEVSPEQALYDSTLATYKDGKYEAALVGFESFISKFPNSKLTDNARFWIGECYMSMGRYDKAILAYQEVIKKYPSGNKVPNALLRQAVAFHKIGDDTSAKLLLRRLIKKYPTSNEANVARIRLEKMK